ncbi:MAG: hypothetical protein PF483_15355 [Halothiobacillus sp.]|nr:hypothetical protein [Halothiobacillus sp.]
MERELLIQFLRNMLCARRLEERLALEDTLGNIGGFLHLYPGGEAVADVARMLSTLNEHLIRPDRLLS